MKIAATTSYMAVALTTLVLMADVGAVDPARYLQLYYWNTVIRLGIEEMDRDLLGVGDKYDLEGFIALYNCHRPVFDFKKEISMEQ